MVPSEKMRQWAQTTVKEIPLKHKRKYLYCEDDQTLEQVVQQGCELSILGDTQNSSGNGPEQLTVVDPTFNRRHGLDYL